MCTGENNYFFDSHFFSALADSPEWSGLGAERDMFAWNDHCGLVPLALEDPLATVNYNWSALIALILFQADNLLALSILSLHPFLAFGSSETCESLSLGWSWESIFISIYLSLYYYIF